jgi:hypothetical protein
MKTLKNPAQKLLIATLTLALAACGGMGNQEDPTTGAEEISFALDQEYAGLTEEDEAPDFDDEEIANAPDLNDDGEDVDDLTADEAEEDLADSTLIAPRRVKVLLAWGLLRGNPFEVENVTDWSGTITAENAGLRIRRVLGFEPATGDHIVRPRPDFSTVELVSTTKPHVDGLLVEVVMHPALGTTLETPPALVINTAAFQGTLPIRPLMPRANLVPVDDQGNAIAYHVIPNRPDRPDCLQGFIAGRWQPVDDAADPRVKGRIKGKVMNENGRVIGKMRGVYGERATNGSQVAFAKIIDNEGRFRAVLAARYADGHFRGRVVGKNRVRKGVVAGQYRNVESLDGGLFRGRYSELCGELPGEGTPEAHDEEQDGLEELDETQLDDEPADASSDPSNSTGS